MMRTQIYIILHCNRLFRKWFQKCEDRGNPLPAKAVREMKKRIASKKAKAKLNLSSCQLEDDHVCF